VCRAAVIPLSLFALWAVAACEGDISAPETGESFTLAPGEGVALGALGHVRFQGVVADSRCPLRLQCVWAGDGAVVLEVIPRTGDAVEHTLHTLGGAKAIVLDSYELTLIELSPYPEVPGGIRPEDYRVTLALVEALD